MKSLVRKAREWGCVPFLYMSVMLKTTLIDVESCTSIGCEAMNAIKAMLYAIGVLITAPIAYTTTLIRRLMS